MMYFTDFLAPDTEAGRDKDAVPFGGYEGAERCMFGYFDGEVIMESFPIEAVEISYNTKFSRDLTHRDFLGSILSLGINRSKIGDILIYYGKAVVFAHKKMVPYILENLMTVASASVETRRIELSDIDIPLKLEVTDTINVPSLRLDAIVSTALNIPRGKAAGLIDSGKVFINWKEASGASKQIAPGDVITVRGSGRIKVTGISGKTKKDRFIIEIQKNI